MSVDLSFAGRSAVAASQGKALERSKTELATELDIKLSTPRNYPAHLGARLELVAVFEEDDEQHSVPIHVGAPTESSRSGEGAGQRNPRSGVVGGGVDR